MICLSPGFHAQAPRPACELHIEKGASSGEMEKKEWNKIPKQESEEEVGENAVHKWLLQQRAAKKGNVTAKVPVMAKPKARPKIIGSPHQKELEERSSSARQLEEMIATVRKNISETHIFCQAFPYIIRGFPEDIRQHFQDWLLEGESVASECADLYDAENVQGRVWTSVSEVTSSKAALDKACKNLKATAKWLKKDVFDPICAASRVRGKQEQVAPPGVLQKFHQNQQQSPPRDPKSMLRPKEGFCEWRPKSLMNHASEEGWMCHQRK